MILGTDRLFIDVVESLSSSIRPIAFVNSAPQSLKQATRGADFPAYEVAVPAYPYTITDEQQKSVSPITYARFMKWLYQETKKRLPETLRIFNHEKVDLIHTLTSVAPLGSLSASSAGLPHIWHTGETIINKGWKQRIWLQYMQWSSEAIVGISERTARDYGPKAVVINNGIQVRSISNAYAKAEIDSLISQYNIDQNDVVLCCIGTIQYTKGQLVLVNALEELQNSRPDLSLKLFLVGPRIKVGIYEDYFQELNQRITQVGLKESVILTGYRQDFIRFIKLASIVVHPVTTADSYPAAIRDAMICGKPVIGTRSGGIPEMIMDGENGLVVAPNDIKGLSKAIEALADNMDLRRRLSVNAIQFATNKFDASIMSAKIERLYDRVLDSLPIKDW